MDDVLNTLKDAPALRSVAARYAALGLPATPRPVTRFAPSPTGEMHLGHVAHALWVWGVAAAIDATVVIRMEDHDRTRSRREYERAILNDLEWLGFAGDPASRASLDQPSSPFRQSDMHETYEEAFARVSAVTRVYGCVCTRSQLGEPDEAGERLYTGTCREHPLQREGKFVVRAQIPDEEVRFHDLRIGPLAQRPAREQGDVMVRDALGQWTYQFGVVVDDMRHGVNVVVRGEDLVRSTGRQILLARLLGRTDPLVTVHHPLLYAPDGRKLSKRDQSETVRSMRERGMTAGDVLQKAVKDQHWEPLSRG